MPFKVFTNGVPLPASDLNDYLMEQSIATFPDSAARAAQLVSPTEGQMTYLADTDRHEFWTGSAWTLFGASQVLLSNTTLTGASVTISSIPQTYNDLLLVVRNFRPSVDAGLLMRFNGLTTTIYGDGAGSATAPSLTSWRIFTGSALQDNAAGSTQISYTELYDYTNATTWRLGRSISMINNATNPIQNDTRDNPIWAHSTAAITSLTLLPSTGTFTSGTALLYGVK